MAAAPKANAALAILHAFSGPDGSQPEGITLAADGKLYGVTLTSGANPACALPSGGYSGCGTVFRIGPGNSFRTLASMDIAKGTVLTSPLMETPTHQLFGVSQNGGSSTACTNGCGTVFRLHSGTGAQTLLSFDGPGQSEPYSPLLSAAPNLLYGATFAGGDKTCSGGCGTIFSMTPAGKSTVIARFALGNGAGPFGPMVLDAGGTIYGTGYYGGPAKRNGPCAGSGCGVVFRLIPGQSPTVLHAFNHTDGQNPRGLVAGPDGALYGVTQAGGTGDNGTVFRVTPDGAFTTLARFTGKNGSLPISRLAIAPDGTVYGSTFYGGSMLLGGDGRGVIFRIGNDKLLTPIEYFDFKRGSGPQDLVIGANGLLYGVTQSGGPSGIGVAFSLDPKSPTPDAFDFSSLSGATPNRHYVSQGLGLGGFGVPAPISITGGDYRIAPPGGSWGSWTSSAGMLQPGQFVQLRVQSSTESKGTSTAKLTVGGVTGGFSVVTQ
jgi:uncharacterized repeat protein (TIGR03803 family)